jgi:predicted DNA-binding transcriptional regulator AlpA
MSDTTTPLPQAEYLSVKDICRIYGVCDRTVWDWMRKGHLPKPTRIGPRLLRWKRADIERHLQGGPGSAA